MNRTIYLKPGFYVVLGDKRRMVKFPHFEGQLSRAVPARMALVDTLNEGFEGEVDELVRSIADNHAANEFAVRLFFDALEEQGCLTETKPESVLEASEPQAVGSALPEGGVVVPTPVTFLTQDGRYLWFDHGGKLLLSLTMAEVNLLSFFSEPIEVNVARKRYMNRNKFLPLDESEFDALMLRLAGAGVFESAEAEEDSGKVGLLRSVQQTDVQELVDKRVAAHDEMVANAGKDLVQVVPVHVQKACAPASLGMVMAYAMEYEGGRLKDRYDFVPMFLTDEERTVARADVPGVFLFSNYLWTVEENLQIAAAVKAVNPLNITIHGGPSTPSYDKDREQFFRENPQVDIAVRAEGEATFADVLDKLEVGTGSLESLRAVPGISFRSGDGVHTTEDRERIADLNTIPSPYLMGLFDEFGSVGAYAIFETNRGCPYGCTFCDWGSATLSKVRRFDLDRVFAELEWSAKHKIENASLADANFGMLERDVDIAVKITDLKREYGYPRFVPMNYAKNQVRYLRKIVEIFAEVDILTEGLVSLQSMDETTLKVIDRSNIKIEKYQELATEFRIAKLPLAADIMMGLPGSTPASFAADLQKCTNLNLRVRANRTTLLPNSPMNEPGYREEHGIVAKPGEIVMEAASYTREDWHEMDRLRLAYYLFDAYGLLRYVARFVRREVGIGEVEFYDHIRKINPDHAAEFPVVATALDTMERHMAPPGSWGLFIQEISQYVQKYLGVKDDSALGTTLEVQLAHLPSPGREFPVVLELEHDFASWQDCMFTARDEGHHHDWENHIPRLSEFGPAKLSIEDPGGVCERDMGRHKKILDMNLVTWDLVSEIARPRLGLVSQAS